MKVFVLINELVPEIGEIERGIWVEQEQVERLWVACVNGLDLDDLEDEWNDFPLINGSSGQAHLWLDALKRDGVVSGTEELLCWSIGFNESEVRVKLAQELADYE